MAPIDDRGDVALDEFERLLSPRTRMVARAHVSNALGTVLPVARLARAARACGTAVLVDGAQAAPHLPIDVRATRVILMRLMKARFGTLPVELRTRVEGMTSLPDLSRLTKKVVSSKSLDDLELRRA